MSEKRPFGLRDQLGYVCGDMGGCFVNNYVDAYFLTFCTYVLNIDPFFLGGLFFVARVLDAVSAPLIGSIPDRWRLGKSGDRYKPYVRLAALPLALSGLACYTDITGLSKPAQMVWVSAAYLFYCICYSFAAIPYGSLASVMTADPSQRTRLSTCRSLGGTSSGLIIALVPQFVFHPDTGAVIGERFFQIALLFGTFTLLSYTCLLANTEERLHIEPKQEGYSYKRVLQGVGRNRPLFGLMVAGLGSMLFGTAQNQLRTYLFKEYYLAPQLVTWTTVAQLCISLPTLFFAPRVADRWGKRRFVLTVLSFSTLVSLALFLFPLSNPWVYLVLNTFAMAGNMALSSVIWAMAIDCIDYQEYITGERNDGSVYSIFTFSRKLGSALASTIASFSLGLIGFVSDAAAQTALVRTRIRSLCTGVPFAANLVILLGIAFIYNLNQKDVRQIGHALAERRKKAS